VGGRAAGASIEPQAARVVAPARARAGRRRRGGRGGCRRESFLALWGRPGRDSIRLYNELSDCNFHERFEDPAAGMASPTLLATLQREVLERAPRRRDPAPRDESLVMFGATDPRRELETVAAEIWSLVRRDGTLRFDDFAVVVPASSSGTYLPLAREVFATASELPHTVLDLPSAAEGHVLAAVELLLALPSGPLGRPELLQLAMHPMVARRFPDVDPEVFLALCEQLGIVRGADGGDLAKSYADDDRVSWDQGLKRLALGAFLSGRRSGEERPFSFEGQAMLAAELPAGAEPAARALGIIARELIDFARTARGLIAPVARFMALLRRTLAATIRPAGPEEQAALGDCFALLERIAAAAPPDLEVGYGVAAELVRARLGAAQRRSRTPEGVAVATFAPLRALPFRIVFMLGLDERVFPSPAGFGALDLRAAAPQPGDVTPREQDEYVFLETLLSARERLYLSYIGRDAETGERKDASSTLLALQDVLGRGTHGDELLQHVTRAHPPLARHRDDALCAVMPAAARERQAVALGQSLRQAAGVIQLPEASALRASLPVAAWTAIAPPLGQLGLGAKTDAPRRPVTTLTLADLRRFLECPLQGSVRVLLPMRDDDDAEDEAEAALRDRESLGDARVQTLPCCAICSRARSTPARATTPRWPSATTPRSPACGSTARCPRVCSAGSCAPVTSVYCARGEKASVWPARDLCRPPSRGSGSAPRPSTGVTSRSIPSSRCRCRFPTGRATSHCTVRPRRSHTLAESGWRWRW
jgi:exodeoxyribonuclease V gamma subunit